MPSYRTSSFFSAPEGYVWRDKFCKMYWNHVTKSWQRNISKDCAFTSKAAAREETVYFIEDDDIKLEYYSQLALAA